MKLACDKCGREYRFPDGMKALVLLDGPHEAIPAGSDCGGFLRSEELPPSGEIDFRSIAAKHS